jgi:hypothetical protein
MVHILESSAPSAQTHTVGVDGGFGGVLSTLQTLRPAGTPDNYTVVPGTRPDSWHLTVQHDQRNSLAPADTLARHRPILEVRDITHAAIAHTSLELNNQHSQAVFLAQVLDAIDGKIVDADGRKLRRFSADMTSVEAVRSFVRAFPGIARSLQVNPAFEHLPLAFGEHPMNRNIGEHQDRPDFSPETRRGVVTVNVVESLGADLRVLDAIVSSRLAVESVSSRLRADQDGIHEMVLVIDDATTEQLQRLQAAFVGTAHGVLSTSLSRPDRAFQFVQGVLPREDRGTKSTLREINQRIHSHGRIPCGHEVLSSSLALPEAAQFRSVLAQAGRPHLSNGALLRGTGDRLPAPQDRFAEHFPEAVADYQGSMQRFLADQLGLSLLD